MKGLRLVKNEEPKLPRVEVVVRVFDADGALRAEDATSAALVWTDEGQVEWEKLDAEQVEACLRQVSSSYAGAVRMILGLPKNVASPGLDAFADRLMRKSHRHRVLK